MTETKFSVVLVRPQFAGNLGSVARAMKNFALSRLLLVNPGASPQELDARKMAMNAQDLLAQAEIFEDLPQALQDFDWVVGTSRRLGKDRQREITPRDFARQSFSEKKSHRVAILFGHEESGLSNDEIELCQQIVCIPSDEAFPSLNLSHAVSLIAYELFVAAQEFLAKPSQRPTVKAEDLPAPFENREAMYQDFEKILEESGFFDSGNPRHVMRLIRNLLNRAHPTHREIQMLRGIFRQLRWWKNHS